MDDVRADARALPAERRPDMVAIRVGETRTVLVDCRPLLRGEELIGSVGTAELRPGGPTAVGARARGGARLVEVTVEAPADISAAWRDHILAVPITTTRGQRLRATVTLRVQAE